MRRSSEKASILIEKKSAKSVENTLIINDFSMTDQEIIDFFNDDGDEVPDLADVESVIVENDSGEVVEKFFVSQFIEELQSDAHEAVQVYEKQVTAERFAQGTNVAVGIMNSLGSFLGACGPLCLHGVGQIANAGASLSSASSAASGLSGISVGGLDVRSDGSFSWNGNISDLANAAGVSPQDITSGRVSPDMLWQNIFGSYLGNGLSMAFGFGLISALVDMILPGEGSQPVGQRVA